MKVTHVIKSISLNSGGTSTYIAELLSQISESLSNTLICYDDNDPIEILGDIKVKKVDQKNDQIMGYSTCFNTLFKTELADLFHGNGTWDLPIHQMARIAKKREIPYLISVHGMLEPWPLTQGTIKKKLARMLFVDKSLHKANCIHATAKSEADNLRKLGFKNPIAIIPNGINLSNFPNYEKKIKTKRKILFLSRIHVKKGIENLIEAWSMLDSSVRLNWFIEIIGNGEENYILSLKKLIKNKGLSKSIIIHKPVFGKDKIAAYQSADLFVLPTYSENFGIVIAEALAFKLPVITTVGTPWEELNTHEAGWWIKTGVSPLFRTLNNALKLSNKDLFRMGKNGRELIKKSYTSKAVSAKMIKLYRWIVNDSDKPEFVI